MNLEIYDLIIVGAGPAGLTAGLYAARYKLNTLILEKMAVGGQIMLSPSIENFPGFPGGVSTQELIERLKKQIEEYNVKIELGEVLGISSDSGPEAPVYNIKIKDKTYQTKTVIIAAGAQPRKLNIKGEERLTGRGVSYCATCDGPLFRNKEIVVIGAGDRAIEEAIFLSGYARKVTVIHRRKQLRASKILEERAYQNAKINFILDTIVEEISGENKVEALKIKNVKTEAVSNFVCQGVFIFAGIRPDTAFLNNQLEVNAAGFIITNEDLEASKKGIFACGDCRLKSLYQVITACGDGATAAASAHKYLS